MLQRKIGSLPNFPPPKIPRSYICTCMYPISPFTKIQPQKRWQTGTKSWAYENGKERNKLKEKEKKVELRKEKHALSLKERGGRMTVPFFWRILPMLLPAVATTVKTIDSHILFDPFFLPLLFVPAPVFVLFRGFVNCD